MKLTDFMYLHKQFLAAFALLKNKNTIRKWTLHSFSSYSRSLTFAFSYFKFFPPPEQEQHQRCVFCVLL